MNGCQSSTESLYSERQYNLQRVSDFHAVLLGMAAHDLRHLAGDPERVRMAERQVR